MKTPTEFCASTLYRPGIKYVSGCVAVLASCLPVETLAHAGDRGFILLLPTKLFIAGGAAAVALSFVVALLAIRLCSTTDEPVLALNDGSTAPPALWPGLAVLFFIVALVAAGFSGSRDPLANPLPLTVWSGWWVGFTILQALFGNIWTWLNPWHAAYRLLPLRRVGIPAQPLLRYPSWLGYWPAFLLLLLFAWLELVYPAPQDPALLAWMVSIYALVTVSAMILFGPRQWLGKAEAFTVFFTMIAWLAPLDLTRGGRGRLVWPGSRLLQVMSLPPSGVCFILLSLATVSFDGLSRTFWWLGLIGENPLEYPGRTAMVSVNTLGLLGTFCLFLTAYTLVLAIARKLGGDPVRASFGTFVLSIIPIAFGYHFAHYLPAFLVDAQYMLKALSDPFALGWDIFGTSALHVRTSFLTHHHSVESIWYCQVSIIVLAHICAVAVAHLLTLRTVVPRHQIVLSQVPATTLMILYTIFGLWLLSAPTAV